MSSTAAGKLIESALDIDFALQRHVRITLDEISAPEFSALKMIASERDRYNEERRQEPSIGTAKNTHRG